MNDEAEEIDVVGLLEACQSALANSLSYITGVAESRRLKPNVYERSEIFLKVQITLGAVTDALDTLHAQEEKS